MAEVDPAAQDRETDVAASGASDSSTAAAPTSPDSDEREFTQVAVAELEVLISIAAEYRKIPVSDGRPRMRQRKLLKLLDASRA